MKGQIMRAVALSGGGDKGAFSVGVLKRLSNKGESFDIISGTSTGAPIAPMLAAGEIDEIWNIYKNVAKSDVMRENDLIKAVIPAKLFTTYLRWKSW
ncbi:MAG: patatin-like phospholipase family protein [Ignavibacteria bacterium]|nr:patatin-like phospholipase family protein [Ignavibacteria bacterium]